MHPRNALLASCFVVALAASTRARAEPPAALPPTDDARADAAHKFAEGEAAFAASDFRHAAAMFEAAYHLAPHYNALWNAARAWQRAGDKARAATLYARYLVEAPAQAPGVTSATSALAELAGKLGRVALEAPGLTDLHVDDELAVAGVVYVLPGPHVFAARKDDREARREETLLAGAQVTIVLALPELSPAATQPSLAPPTSDPNSIPTPPLPPTASPSPSSSPPSAPIAEPSARGRPVPPLVVYAGAALTLAGIVGTVISGIDTLNFKKHHYDPDLKDDSPAVPRDIADGLFREQRTNALLGVTLGVAAVTGALAIGFVDWRSGSRRVGLATGPGFLEARGCF